MIGSDGVLQVSGWAISLTTLVAVQVYVDDGLIASARLGIERDDLAVAYPAYPNARVSGFTLSFQLPDDKRHGTVVRAHAIGTGGFAAEASIPIDRVAARLGGLGPAVRTPPSAPPPSTSA